jgi:hypothetical protein
MTDEKEKNEVVVSSHEEYNKTVAALREKNKRKDEAINSLKSECAAKDRVIEDKDDENKKIKEELAVSEKRRREAEDKYSDNSPYGYPRSNNETKEQKFEREYKEGLEKFNKNSVSNRINK